MRNRLFAWLICLVLTATGGCGKSDRFDTAQTSAPEKQETGAKEPVFRFGIGFSGDGYAVFLKDWKEKVFQETGGDVELELFGGNILGAGSAMCRAVQKGTLSVVATSTSATTDIVPEAAIMDIPGCFPAYSVPHRIYSGEFFEKLNECYEAQGLELLGLRTGEPWIISSGRKTEHLSELRGKTVRTSGSRWHNRLYDALGMKRVEDISLGGLTYLLDDGKVDGIETTYEILRTQGLVEKQPYGLNVPFFHMSSSITMNLEAYESLPDEYRKVLKNTLLELMTKEEERMAETVPDGMEFVSFGREDMETLKEAAEPIRKEILDLVDEELKEAFLKENAGRE